MPILGRVSVLPPFFTFAGTDVFFGPWAMFGGTHEGWTPSVAGAGSGLRDTEFNDVFHMFWWDLDCCITLKVTLDKQWTAWSWVFQGRSDRKGGDRLWALWWYWSWSSCLSEALQRSKPLIWVAGVRMLLWHWSGAIFVRFGVGGQSSGKPIWREKLRKGKYQWQVGRLKSWKTQVPYGLPLCSHKNWHFEVYFPFGHQMMEANLKVHRIFFFCVCVCVAKF